mmetsp:Transcript_66593/g.173262  ORF Transcript_66593/g.173262 Transcript_66593/m.173262 type:complete len:262 (+) Transcript_66593:43-828(+)
MRLRPTRPYPTLVNPLLVDCGTPFVRQVPVQLLVALHGQWRRGQVRGEEQDAHPLQRLHGEDLVRAQLRERHMRPLIPVVELDVGSATGMNSGDHAGKVALAVVEAAHPLAHGVLQPALGGQRQEARLAPLGAGVQVDEQRCNAVLQVRGVGQRVHVVPEVLTLAVAGDLCRLEVLGRHTEEVRVPGLQAPRLAPGDPELAARAVDPAVRGVAGEPVVRSHPAASLDHHPLALILGQETRYQEDPWVAVYRSQPRKVGVYE